MRLVNYEVINLLQFCRSICLHVLTASFNWPWFIITLSLQPSHFSFTTCFLLVLKAVIFAHFLVVLRYVTSVITMHAPLELVTNGMLPVSRHRNCCLTLWWPRSFRYRHCINWGRSCRLCLPYAAATNMGFGREELLALNFPYRQLYTHILEWYEQSLLCLQAG